MNRSAGSRIVLTVIVVLVVISLPFQQAAAERIPHPIRLSGTWHRLNPGSPPEHEVLHCTGNQQVFCFYGKYPEPELGFADPPDATFGHFRGENLTANWSCPGWFPAEVCANKTFVARGKMTYMRAGSSQGVLRHVLLVTKINGQNRLYDLLEKYNALCPWFRSFKTALDSNPFPLPYNGQDGPASDCFRP